MALLMLIWLAMIKRRGEGAEEAVIKKKTKAKGKVVKVTARRREAMGLVKFIDAHGGRLGAFRGYGAPQSSAVPFWPVACTSSPLERR
jgi:hypothetical protein